MGMMTHVAALRAASAPESLLSNQFVSPWTTYEDGVSPGCTLPVMMTTRLRPLRSLETAGKDPGFNKGQLVIGLEIVSTSNGVAGVIGKALDDVDKEAQGIQGMKVHAEVQ
eukprot:CAMPEP_0175039542 /NCGR_PEP_ID=MMETSP0052_2-20121109/657_1 /TAXON_ID=51329 ORGANISM="Polytomella parva, Strain SAG 63-3" /NCGR_SAMPLE_ID=MMETSP0052_2 /ASSEMBLY_ACC=CAM_ASM_000194 /LENGTH=110 /DNA_ID=CAMNT_0016301437 /DNA_START=1472 /DNA_END=1805 /DNA_ORIENTATION=-